MCVEKGENCAVMVYHLRKIPIEFGHVIVNYLMNCFCGVRR